MAGIPIRGRSPHTAADAYAEATARGAQRTTANRTFFEALYRDASTAGTDADVHVAQWDLETGSGTSDEWRDNLNPGGVGVFPDGTTAGYRFTPESAACELVTHMLVYAGIPRPAGWTKSKRWDVVVGKGWAGTVTTTADLGNGKWATDPDYARKLRERYTAYWGHPPLQETSPMSLKPYTDIPGRPGLTFWLPSDVDVRTRVVNHARVRSYRKFTAQQHDIVHDTGNDRTTAEGEYSWLAGGRQGGEAGGYNAITDSRRIWFTGMFDEITWHGGTTAGNQTFGAEMAYGGGQNWDRVLEVNARYHAALCVAFGFDPDDQLHLHQWVYGKYCSRQILDRRLWPQYLATVKRYMEEIKAAMRGQGEPIPNPATYAKPVPIVALDEALAAVVNPDKPALTIPPRSVYDPQSKVRFYWVGDRVRALRDTGRKQYASAGAGDVGGTIAAETEFDVNWLFIAGDGKEWYLTPYNTRVFAEDTERVSDNKAAA